MSVMTCIRMALRTTLVAGLLCGPVGAHADNECAPVGVAPADNGGDPDAFICSGTYNDGIQYSADGDLTLSTSTSTLNLGSSGRIVLSGGSDETVTFIANGNVIGGSASTWTLDLDIDGLARIENHASISRSVQITSGDQPSTDAVIRAAGAGQLIIDNHDTIKGRVDFSALSGGVTFNITGSSTGGTTSIYAPNIGWNTTGDSVFSPADDVVDIQQAGWLQTSSGGYRHPYVTEVPPPPETTIDFGDGDDLLRNGGLVILGTSNQDCHSTSRCPPRASRTILENLETFENAGLILMGRGGGFGSFESPEGTDFVADDVLVAHGVHFVGGAGSRIVLDAILSGGGQGGCGGPLVADCIDLSGGSTSGVTQVEVRDVFAGDRGDPVDVTLIDVSGGSSGAGHFVLDPASSRYNPAHGGVIDKGLLLYPLVYDPERQQHVLKAAPSDDALQLPMMVELAESAWRAVTPDSDARQSALLSAGSASGAQLWLAGKAHRGSRSAPVTVMAVDRPLHYDNTHDLDLSSLNVGLDMVRVHDGNAETHAGGMIGYVRGSVDFDHSASDAKLDGVSLGAYARHQRGAFHADAVVNMVWSELDFTVPDLGLSLGQTSNTMTTDVASLGGQLEAGWTWQSDALRLTPIVTLQYVETRGDDMVAPSSGSHREKGVIDLADNRSVQAGLGLRLSFGTLLGPLHAQWRLSAEALQELDEDSEVTLSRGGFALPLDASRDSSIVAVSGGVAVQNASGHVAAYLDLDWLDQGTFDRAGVSLGFRYRW